MKLLTVLILFVAVGMCYEVTTFEVKQFVTQPDGALVPEYKRFYTRDAGKDKTSGLTTIDGKRVRVQRIEPTATENCP